jgi:hypothetical protein
MPFITAAIADSAGVICKALIRRLCACCAGAGEIVMGFTVGAYFVFRCAA